MRRFLAGIAVSLSVVAGAQAQESRLQGRMNGATYAEVKAILDSARRNGLPTRPIEDKALEGLSAGAQGPAIVAALRTFTLQMNDAATALGRKSTADELRAAVGAIEAGVSPRDLARIRASAGRRSLATTLTVISDIVVRGVPVGTATNLSVSLLRAKVKDPELLDFARLVRLDIGNGGNPSTAASARARGKILVTGAARPAR
jgi:hypothetical protein